MRYCPECGEENPDRSKFCRNCGINLVHEEETEKIAAKKVKVESNTTSTYQTTVNTNTSTNNKKNNNDNGWCLGCCICVFFLFLIFAIAGH